MHRFEKLHNLSTIIFEINFYQNLNKWKHNLFRIEINVNGSDSVVDLIIYKNPYGVIRKITLVLGNHNKCFICRRCLSSYTNENTLINHKLRCEEQEITTIRTSNESHFHWKKDFNRNSSYFRIIADFEVK